MTEHKKFIVRTRGIIIYNEKILVMKHQSSYNYYALPGGHMELGENVIDSTKREITEELGIEPQVGRLLFINNFTREESQSVEFFFEITNGKDYLDTTNIGGTHKHEFVELIWMDKDDSRTLLPKSVQNYFNSGTLLSDAIRFLSDK